MILLVEDNELIQELVSDVCRSVGLAVYCAPRCRMALAALRYYHDFKLVLMDYKLAGPNSGIACAAAIRTTFQEPYASIPIIGMTGGLYPGINPELVAAAKINGQIVKPFRIEELVSVLDRYLPPHTRSGFAERNMPDEGEPRQETI